MKETNLKKNIESIHKKLIVSCQALDNEPLHSPFIIPIIGRFTHFCISEIQKCVNLPIIGIVKRDYEDSNIYITPTMKEIDELMEVKPDIIALDATCDIRPNGLSLQAFYNEIREKYPEQLLMADCSTIEEMLNADAMGFDFIGTTLVGYTNQSKGLKIENNDFEIIRKVLKLAKHPLIAEGNIDTPEKAKRVIELGAYSVVVGSIITRPQIITRSFVNALELDN